GGDARGGAGTHRTRARVGGARAGDPGGRLRHEVPAARGGRRQAALDGGGRPAPARAVCCQVVRGSLRARRSPPATSIGYKYRCITSASTRPEEGCRNALGKRPTTAKPRRSQRRTARSFVLTTKL